jgi:DNA-binding CsgD family transcriptional regulator
VWSEFGFINPARTSWRSEAALAAFAEGDVDAALEWAGEAVRLATSWKAPGALGQSLRVLGMVKGSDEGLLLLERSVRVLDGSLARVELTRSLAAYGAALRRTGRRNDAQGQLSRALDLADALGAVALSSQVMVELRAAGFRPRRHRLTGPGSLTVSERRVADLAARGKSNRTIAQELFVTTKTVELHLTNAYRKLGVSGRRELATALSRSS